MVYALGPLRLLSFHTTSPEHLSIYCEPRKQPLKQSKNILPFLGHRGLQIPVERCEFRLSLFFVNRSEVSEPRFERKLRVIEEFGTAVDLAVEIRLYVAYQLKPDEVLNVDLIGNSL